MESALNDDGNDIILPPSSFKMILLTVLCLRYAANENEAYNDAETFS
jgi:hypothetical protein